MKLWIIAKNRPISKLVVISTTIIQDNYKALKQSDGLIKIFEAVYIAPYSWGHISINNLTRNSIERLELLNQPVNWAQIWGTSTTNRINGASFIEYKRVK